MSEEEELERRQANEVPQVAEEVITPLVSSGPGATASMQESDNHSGRTSSDGNVNAPPTLSPPRRRGRRPRMASSMAQSPSATGEACAASCGSTSHTAAPLPRLRGRPRRETSTASAKSDQDAAAPRGDDFLRSAQMEHDTASARHGRDVEKDRQADDSPPSRFTTPVGANLAGVNIGAMLTEVGGEAAFTYTRRLRRNRRRQALTEDDPVFRDHRELRRTHQRRSHPTAPMSTAVDVLQSITEWNDSPALVYAQLLWQYTPEAMLGLVLGPVPHATSIVPVNVKLERPTPTSGVPPRVKQETHDEPQ